MPIKITNPKYELSAFESFVKDIYDPLEFKRKIVKVQKPTVDGYEIVPFEPYPFQNMWTADTSSLKFTAKSRQIGFSYNELIDSFHKAITTPNYLKMFISLRAEDANELLKIVTSTIDLIEDEWKVPLVSKSVNLLQFENGSRLMALPAKNAGRSKHGDVFIDESAFIPNLEKTLTSIMQSTVRGGYTVAMGSTPLGQQGKFHQILKEAGWDTNSVWTDREKGVQPYLIKNFYREYLRFRNETESNWSIHIIPHWFCPDLEWNRMLERAETNEAFLQEYGVAFLDDTTAVFPYELMLSRSNENIVQYKENDKVPYNKKVRRVAGLDIAEKKNQTVFIMFEKIDDVYYKKFKKTWTGVDHKTYVPQIIKFMDRMHVDHLYVDSTGYGYPVFVEMQRHISPSRITGVNLTQQVKIDLIYNMLSLYEAGSNNDKDYQIWTDVDEEYFTQLHHLRRTIAKNKKASYSGKSYNKDDDIVWATALALSENITGKVSSFEFATTSFKENYVDEFYGRNRFF